MNYRTLLVFILALFMFGCSAKGIMKNRTATGGVGTIFEPRGSNKDMAIVRFSINIHFENRPDENTFDKLGEALKNITGIPQAIVTALTSPERTVETVVGSDRREIHIPFEIDISQKSTVAIRIQIGKKIKRTLEKNNIDATVSIGNQKSGIKLNGLTIEVIKTNHDLKMDSGVINYNKVKNSVIKNW
jgi:hypothetical protein